MSYTGKELIRVMNQYAPPELAMDQDRIGLQIGSADAEVRGVLVALDVTENVVAEAVQRGANWIITHHAMIFRPLSQIRTDQPEGKLIAELLMKQMQVFVAHTNLDIAPQGVNDSLAERIGLEKLQVLITTEKEKMVKLVVFVPNEYQDSLREALGEAGAGWIGNYSHCSFNLQGVGTFLPREGASPFIGSKNELERVDEIRIETIVPVNKLKPVLQAMVGAHPYEEVAYDLYPLEQEGMAYGLGRIGRLSAPSTLQHVIEQVKKSFAIQGLRFVGSLNQPVEKVAIIGGSGSRYWKEAAQQGADVLITGDIDYHTALDAREAGFCLIDPGHHIEHWVVDSVVQRIKKGLGGSTPVYASQTGKDPFRFS